MLKLTFVTAHNFIVLGINGVTSFVEVNGDNTDAVQKIDDTFLIKIRAMQTHDFGFTDEVKKRMLDVFKNDFGSVCLIVDEWITEGDRLRTLFLKETVLGLNSGLDFEAAKEQARQTISEFKKFVEDEKNIPKNGANGHDIKPV